MGLLSPEFAKPIMDTDPSRSNSYPSLGLVPEGLLSTLQPNAEHPAEIARIMKLLPQIPATASFDKINEILGLPKEWDGGSVSATHCTMVWRNLAPGYDFTLNFSPEGNDEVMLVFTEASFSAQGHTVYPYRSWKGMVGEAQKGTGSDASPIWEQASKVALRLKGGLLGSLIQEGMTKDEVESILGKGDKPFPTGCVAGSIVFISLSYHDLGLSVSLTCDETGVYRVGRQDVCFRPLFD